MVKGWLIDAIDVTVPLRGGHLGRWRMRLLTLSVLAFLSATCAKGQPVTRVRVLDADFKLAKVLDAAEIADFERAWKEKRAVEAEFQDVGGRHFKIDVERADASSSRWLYRSTGHARLLTVKATRVYKLQHPAAFNALIGASD